MKTYKSNYLECIFTEALLEKKKEKQKKRKVIVISGPTAVGKTKLSIEIAEILNGEIISADSMQVYRNMDIGTAKVSVDDRKKVKHHLIDVKDVKDNFNVVQYYNEAHKACRDILLRGKVPIVVGGSGFYIHCLIYGPPYGPPSISAVRKNLENQMEKYGIDAMFERLQMIDPEYAQTISEKDKHKVIRALEIIKLTERPVSYLDKSNKINEIYDFRCWFLSMDRDVLYKKVEKRCEEMIRDGFLDEVRGLEKLGISKNPSASQAIGYQQCLKFFKTDMSDAAYDEFVSEFKKSSRKYIKRQYTWFKKEPLFRWLDLSKIGDERAKEYILQDFEQPF